MVGICKGCSLCGTRLFALVRALYQAKKRLRWSGVGTKQTAALEESRRRFLAMNSADFALGSMCPQHWEAVEGAASYVAQETAKQVCQLFGESHSTRSRPIEDDRAQYAGVCTFPSEL